MKNKKKFIFWLIVYILWYLFFFVYCGISNAVLQRTVGESPILLLTLFMKLGSFAPHVPQYHFVGLIGLLLIGIFLLDQTKLKGEAHTKWFLALMGIEFFLYSISLVIEDVIRGEDWVPTLIGIGIVWVFIIILPIVIVALVFKKIGEKWTW